MHIIQLFTASLLTGFSGAIMPGPVLIYTISRSLSHGFISGALAAIGHSLLELFLVIGLTFGLDQLLNNQIAEFVIGTAGGLFLLWMGWGMSKNPVGTAIPIVDKSDADSSRGPISAGIILSATNPYFFVWWATVGLSFIEESREAGTAGVAAFYTGHISADIIWYAMVALTVSSGKKFLSDTTYKVIVRCCGIFLICLGLYFAYAGKDFIQRILT